MISIQVGAQTFKLKMTNSLRLIDGFTFPTNKRRILFVVVNHLEGASYLVFLLAKPGEIVTREIVEHIRCEYVLSVLNKSTFTSGNLESTIRFLGYFQISLQCFLKNWLDLLWYHQDEVTIHWHLVGIHLAWITLTCHNFEEFPCKLNFLLGTLAFVAVINQSCDNLSMTCV